MNPAQQKPTQTRKRPLWILLLLLAASNAPGTNLHFLKYDPVSQLTAEDWERENQAFSQAVEKGEDGQAVTWASPETGNSGSVTVIERFVGQDGQPCRKILETFQSKQLDSRYTVTVCKAGDDWKVVSAKR